MRRLFAASRFVVGLAVVASFVGSAILLVMATLTVLRMALREIFEFDIGTTDTDQAATADALRRQPDAGSLSSHHLERLGVELIQVIDIILLGTVLYIVSLGLYQLFIDHGLSLSLPHWLVVDDLNDLKRLLIGVTVVLLGVTFLGEVVEGDGEPNILQLGVAVALVVIALGVILWVHPNEPHVGDDTAIAATDGPSAPEG